MALYSLLLIDRMASVTHQWSRRRHRPPPPPCGEWPALTSVTHRDDAVDGSPCIHLNNRPLLSLLLAKLASCTSLQKPPAPYTRVNDFGPHTDSIFRARLILENDLYASIYGTTFCILMPLPWKNVVTGLRCSVTTVYRASCYGCWYGRAA